METVGFVAGGKLAVGDGDDGEALRRVKAGTMPPVATDSAAGEVANAVDDDFLVDVDVALKNTQNIVAFEQAHGLRTIDKAVDLVGKRVGWLEVRMPGVGERNMDRDDDGCAEGLGRKVVGEPCELDRINLGPVPALGGEANRVKNDKVVALVIERVISGAEKSLEHFLAIAGIGGADAGVDINAEAIVVAKSVIELKAEILLGLAVEVEEFCGASGRDAECIENMVAALDGEVCGNGAGVRESHPGAMGGVKFVFRVGVRDKKKGEGFGFGGGNGEGRRDSQGPSSATQQLEKSTTVKTRSRNNNHSLTFEGWHPVSM